jgi:hypothetical protein
VRIIAVLALFVVMPAVADEHWPVLAGPYLGQEPPGMTPEVFAPGLISLDGERELNAVYSPSGRIFMFTRSIDGVFKMFFSYQRDDGTWQEPRMAPPSKTYPGHRDADMAFSPDGEWVYFISDRPLPGYSLERYNVWRSRYSEHGLLTPEALGPHINGPGHELYPVLVADGSLYFSATRDDSIGGRDSYRAAVQRRRVRGPGQRLGRESTAQRTKATSTSVPTRPTSFTYRRDGPTPSAVPICT